MSCCEHAREAQATIRQLEWERTEDRRIALDAVIGLRRKIRELMDRNEMLEAVVEAARAIDANTKIPTGAVPQDMDICLAIRRSENLRKALAALDQLAAKFSVSRFRYFGFD